MPPGFPPGHTVHASFPAHGVPSPPEAATCDHSSTPITGASQVRSLLFGSSSDAYCSSSSYMFTTYLLLFLVPMNLSVHMLLGACYEPAGWTEPVTQYGVSYSRFYSTAPASVLYNTASDSFIRKFVRWYNHSHHEHFIDSRHIRSTAFLRQVSIWRLHGLRSADFTELLTAKIGQGLPVGDQRRCFRALPRHSIFQFISSRIILSISYLSQSFSLRNKSHRGHWSQRTDKGRVRGR